MPRAVLPTRRHCETFTIEHENIRYTVTVGHYNGLHDEFGAGSPGEVFANMSKREGSPMDNIVRDGAILLSLCLQHGCELSTIKSAITRNADGSPSAIIGVIVDRLIREAVA